MPFLKAGMYRCIDAGDDLEIALRMKDQGKVVFDGRLKVRILDAPLQAIRDVTVAL